MVGALPSLWRISGYHQLSRLPTKHEPLPFVPLFGTTMPPTDAKYLDDLAD